METSKDKEYPSWVLRSHKELQDTSSKVSKCLTWMRPSGKLHLGHYVWALKNWKRLQEMDSINCDFLLADYHVMAEEWWIQKTQENVFEVVKDWLSIWLDPKKSNFVVQSYLRLQPELKEYLSFVAPVSALMKNPTLKAEIEAERKKEYNKEGISIWYYTYPISQVADILWPLANIVPVWDDQLPHIEFTRKVAKKFNKKYGYTFPLPKALLWDVPRLPWISWWWKMWKSSNNSISLSDDADTVRKKIRSMYTDKNRLKSTDPWNVEGNKVFSYLDVFYEDLSHLEDLKDRYRKWGEWSLWDLEIKNLLTDVLNSLLEPIRKKRSEYKNDDQYIRKSIERWTDASANKLGKVLDDVRKKMWVKSY